MFHLFIIREEISGEREGKDEVGAMRQEEGTGQTGWVGVPAGGWMQGLCSGLAGHFCPLGGRRELGMDRFTLRTGGEGTPGRRSPATPWLMWVPRNQPLHVEEALEGLSLVAGISVAAVVMP